MIDNQQKFHEDLCKGTCTSRKRARFIASAIKLIISFCASALLFFHFIVKTWTLSNKPLHLSPLSLSHTHTRKTSSCPNSTSTENHRFMIHHCKYSISKWQEQHSNVLFYILLSILTILWTVTPDHSLTHPDKLKTHPAHHDYQTNLMTILTILRFLVITIVIREDF